MAAMRIVRIVAAVIWVLIIGRVLLTGNTEDRVALAILLLIWPGVAIVMWRWLVVRYLPPDNPIRQTTGFSKVALALMIGFIPTMLLSGLVIAVLSWLR